MSQFDRKMEAWKSRLLDLSRRNRLLYFQPGKGNTVRILSPSPSELFHALVDGEKHLRFPTAVRLPGLDEATTTDEPPIRTDAGDLQVGAEVKDLNRRLYCLRRDFNAALMEQGVHTLFVSVGLLQWKESDSSQEFVQAPILLVPVGLGKESDDKPYTLEPADEETTVNPTLAFKLQNEFAISLPGLPEEMEGFATEPFLNRVASLVRKRGWSVTDEVWVGRFSFEKLAIYKDLESHHQDAKEHPIVSALAGVSDLSQPDQNWSGENLDDVSSDQETYPILDADSSQMETLLRAKSGENLIVYGPPGTGKSQTISNIIAQSLRLGKRVLFVSEKMAALQVVQKRLFEAGLRPAILEVHSHKASKRTVIEELGKTLRGDRAAPLPEATHEFEELRGTLLALNQYVAELHRIRDKRGQSAYRVVGALANLDQVPLLDFSLPFFSALDLPNEDELRIRAALEELISVPEVLDNYQDYPFKGWKLEDLTIQELSDIPAMLRNAAARIGRMQEHAHAFASDVGVEAPTSVGAVQQLQELGDLLAICPAVQTDWFEQGADHIAELRKAAKRGRLEQETFTKARDTLSKLCGLAITGSPVEDLRKRFADEYAGIFQGLFRRWNQKYRDDMDTLRAAWAGPEKLSYGRALKALETACVYNASLQWMASNSDTYARRFGGNLFNQFDTDWGRGDAALDWADKLLNRFRSGVPPKLLAQMNEPGALQSRAAKACGLLAEDLQELSPVRDRLNDLQPEGQAHGPRWQQDSMASLVSWLQDKANHSSGLHHWARFQRAKRRCEDAGLSDFLKQVLDHSVPVNQIMVVYKKRYLIAWLAEAERETPALGEFSGTRREQIIQSYRDLDRRLLRMSAKLTLAKVEAMQPRATATHGTATSQMGVLLREVQKRRRLKPLRRLFSEAPQLIQTLKPCLLMSPLSVSSYLTKGSFHFDLVVFDEASQIPPQDAICSILRAGQAVVAGDDRQLPPTTFFQAGLEDKDYDETDETQIDDAPLESVLDDCAALPSFGRCRLRWHYRSRHEGLIAFSNKEFYGGELITFPSPDVVDPSVHFEYVPGATYDRGGSRTNRSEARRVADLVEKHFETYGHDRSLGVIALSTAQEHAIDEELTRLRQRAPHLVPFFAEDNDESFFVKNLESVQGDERDHIIISICYGPDAAGNTHSNFGPINHAGGERRLNVAVTRAKWSTTVVCSFLPEALDLARLTTHNQGVVKLQAYLEYAYRGKFGSETPIAGDSESDFEDAVKGALELAGLQIDTQVGCSGFRIVLAVRHPGHEGRYILGIECDGAQYHSCRTARDRDRLRQEVPERLGWKILRIWSLDWLKDPEGQIDKVLAHVGELRRQSDWGVPAPPPPVADAAESETEDPPDRLVDTSPKIQDPENLELRPYDEYKTTSIRDSDELYQAEYWSAARERAATELGQIVEFEGPMHSDVAARRLAAGYGIKRLGPKVRQNIDRVIAAATSKKLIRVKAHFLWSTEDKPLKPRRRMGAKEASIGEVALEEIGEAMKLVLESQFGMSQQDLAVETARLMGYHRNGPEVNKRMSEAIRYLLKIRAIARADNQLILADQ